MKKAMKLVSLVLAVVMLLGCLAACSSKSATTDSTASTDTASTDTAASDSSEASSDGGEIVIALISNTTGDYAQYGQPVRDGAMLYINQLNANGGINGKQVKVLEYDDKGDGVEAVNAYNLACDNGITAVFGATLTGTTIALADATYEDNMPQVTASATATGVTVIDPADPESEIRPNVFRACFIDPFQGTMLARYAVKNEYKKIAIMREKDSEYSVGLVKYFQDEIATHDGYEVVALCDFMNKDEDFSALLGAVLDKKPDVIFTSVSYADKAAQIMKQAHALGYEGAFFGGDTLDAPELFSIAGDAAVGAVFTTFYDAAQPATEMTSKFLDAYRAKYGKEPAAPTVMAYDAYLTMRNAIETAGTTDAEAVRDALFATSGFVGAAGSITLNDTHDAVRPVVFKEVQADGSTSFKDMIEP